MEAGHAYTMRRLVSLENRWENVYDFGVTRRGDRARVYRVMIYDFFQRGRVGMPGCSGENCRCYGLMNCVYMVKQLTVFILLHKLELHPTLFLLLH